MDEVQNVVSIYGSPKRGWFLYTHKSDCGPSSTPAAGPYASKADAKRKFKLSYADNFKAWNF